MSVVKWKLMIRTSCVDIPLMRVWCFLWLGRGFVEVETGEEEIEVLRVVKLECVLVITVLGVVYFVVEVEHGESWFPWP